jgi:glutamate-ammonia-ligase adenylyltransferase
VDFAAIADVQSLKRQIHAVKGHGTIAVHGHNIKLGRGGIREIEFFVQALQLIYGGRNLQLQERSTVKALSLLYETRFISLDESEALLDAYCFLRDLEHKLQMVNELQAHELPEDEEEAAA